MSSSKYRVRDGDIVYAKPKHMTPLPLDRQGKQAPHPAVVTKSSHPHEHTIAPISNTPIAPYKAVKEVAPSVKGLKGYMQTNPVQVSKSNVQRPGNKNHGDRVKPDELEEVRGLQATTQAKGRMLDEFKERSRKKREGEELTLWRQQEEQRFRRKREEKERSRRKQEDSSSSKAKTEVTKS
ncbi:hypothetical protein JB92DRAFT_3093278 [Gautieria morchelliformis]|nr:hypothetical protein JB92DRAFT_3093278 [Gautieria morchelliformis]